MSLCTHKWRLNMVRISLSQVMRLFLGLTAKWVVTEAHTISTKNTVNMSLGQNPNSFLHLRIFIFETCDKRLLPPLSYEIRTIENAQSFVFLGYAR